MQPQVWTLKTSKKTTHYREPQKRLLEETFSIGALRRLDAAAVARMSYKKNEVGNRLFAVDEFLKLQQVQSNFSRMAAKLKNRHDGDITEEEITAAEEDGAFSLTRATVIDQCQVADIQPVYFLCVEWFQKPEHRLATQHNE